MNKLKINSPPVCGFLPAGKHNSIADVQGVRVGHCTLDDGSAQTGVTVIVPPGELFLQKPLAAVTILNGFGKSLGLVQLAELGCIETPIALTNTFSVGALATAQIRQAVQQYPKIGQDWPTVNALVLECNDGYLNDIQAMAVTEQHYQQALQTQAEDFAQGSVGAGRGMTCFGVKGGIGSASRLAGGYTVGVLVLANFGKAKQCLIGGDGTGRALCDYLEKKEALDKIHDENVEQNQPNQQANTQADEQEKGSIIMVLATDAPLDSLQLQRLSKRCGNGLARTGSVYGHGSGDIAVAFTTANHLAWPSVPSDSLETIQRLPDTRLDELFQAATEATEQAIIHALYYASSVTGRKGHSRIAFTEVLPFLS